jgi:hypothetical protein
VMAPARPKGETVLGDYCLVAKHSLGRSSGGGVTDIDGGFTDALGTRL